MSGLYHNPVISLSSIGNTITELLGMVVRHAPVAEACKRFEPILIGQFLEIRRRFVEADLTRPSRLHHGQAKTAGLCPGGRWQIHLLISGPGLTGKKVGWQR
jgi:hypothetical protein